MDGYRPFEKYSAIPGMTPGTPGRPGGRPVGVRTGMGTRPNVPSSPILGGLRTSPVPLPGMGGGQGILRTMPMPGPGGGAAGIPGLGGLMGQLQGGGGISPRDPMLGGIPTGGTQVQGGVGRPTLLPPEQMSQVTSQPMGAQQNVQNILNKYASVTPPPGGEMQAHQQLASAIGAIGTRPPELPPEQLAQVSTTPITRQPQGAGIRRPKPTGRGWAE